MLYPLLYVAALLAAPENLLNDPGFSDGLAHWRAEAGAAHVEVSDVEGARAVSIHGDTVEGYPRVVQDFTPEPGALYSAEVLARDTGITGGYGAYMTLEFLGADGKRILFEQSSPALPGGWTPLIARCGAPAAATRGSICLVLRGAGTGLYRAPSLKLLEHAPAAAVAGEVPLKFGDALSTPFLGFGFEDDGWLCTQNNFAKGVTEEDIQRIHARMAWMNPASVRMFFWYKDFNPGSDWTTLDFETENMRSHYRALDVYQKIGAAVNVTGVEWNVKDPWSKPEALAHAVGELFSELITKRGYTCIKQWTLTNEPNTHFLRENATFDTYKQLHLLAAKEFAARGLKIEIIGSDDTNGGLPWFTQCVAEPDYLAATGLLASHFYMQRDSLRAGKYNILDRLDVLAGRKPFVIEEFGFQDARSGAIVNPLMEEFEYALLASSFAIDSVARGTSGLNIWCLHELEYPVGYMSYGLFRFKDKDWSPKPVWYAWSMLTRNARPGAQVQAGAEPLPPGLAVVRIGDAIYFANQSTQAVRIVGDGVALHEARVFDEGCMPGTTDEAAVLAAAEGKSVAIVDGGLTIPARAFGRAW